MEGFENVMFRIQRFWCKSNDSATIPADSVILDVFFVFRRKNTICAWLGYVANFFGRKGHFWGLNLVGKSKQQNLEIREFCHNRPKSVMSAFNETWGHEPRKDYFFTFWPKKYDLNLARLCRELFCQKNSFLGSQPCCKILATKPRNSRIFPQGWDPKNEFFLAKKFAT